jgi:hypothetical protein
MEPKERMEMEELRAELRGRQVAIETIMLSAFAHFAAHFDKPVLLISQVMGDAELILLKAQREAPAEEAGDTAYALSAFAYFSDAMLSHINRHITPQGRG